MIFTIYVPKAIWEEEHDAETLSRFNMQNVFDVETFYSMLTDSFNTDGLWAMELVNAVRDSIMADSTYMGERTLSINGSLVSVNIPTGFDVDFDTTFGFPKVRRDTITDTTHTIAMYSPDLGRNDTIFIRHKKLAEFEDNENFVALVDTESKERSELTNYYDSYQPDSSMYYCPLTEDPYLIAVSDDKSGIRVASPITEMYKERRYLIFSFKAGSHGYINDGLRSWD